MKTPYLSSIQVSSIFTSYSAATIGDLARKGQLPVAFWVGTEPFFKRDVETVRAMLSLSQAEI